MLKRKQATIALGLYSAGFILGMAGSMLAHIHLTAHPQQSPAWAIILHNFSVVFIMLLGIISHGIFEILAFLLAGYSDLLLVPCVWQ